MSVSPYKYKEPLHNKVLTLAGKWLPRERLYTIFSVKADDNQWKPYHCPDCRNMIFKYKGNLMMEIPGEVIVKAPMKVRCKNSSCGRTILWAGSAEQV